MSNVKKYCKARWEQYKSVIESDYAKQHGQIAALKEAGYNLTLEGTTTTCTKGRFILKFGNAFNKAMVTAIGTPYLEHSSNL